MKLGEVAGAERERHGKPLDGLRVLAVEQVQAMPFGTQLMAFLGADVYKVEHPLTGESGRQSQTSLVDDDGSRVGATYIRTNLSKKSIALDLKQEEGRALFLRLVPHFDIVAENFKPGSMQAWGLDYESLAPLHPALIYVSVSGFGNLEPSPYREWPAYAPIVEAMAGIFEALAKPGQRPPHNLGGPIGDLAAALYAVIGTLSAVIQRQRTGLGQYVDVAMFDAMLAMADMVPFMWSMGAPHPAQYAAGLVDAFAAGDGYFVLSVIREHQFQKLAELIGAPQWLSDPRLSTRNGWVDHINSVLRPAIEGWAKERTKAEVSALLCDAGIAAGPYLRPEELPADEHLRMRHMLLEIEARDRPNPVLVVGNPVKMSGVADGPYGRWPKLGEHTAATLRDLLQLDPAEIAALQAKGVIGGPPVQADS